MATVDTEAIILRTYKLAEADKIVVCLTKVEGAVRAVAHGARRLKSRYGASLEPFTHVALSYYSKEGRELVTLKRAEIIKSYFALSKEPDAVNALEYLSQLVIEFSAPHQPDEKLFRLLVACLDATSRAPESVAAIRPYFELWLLKLNGYLPDLGVCAGCGDSFTSGTAAVWLTQDGAAWCGRCREGTSNSIERKIHQQLLSMNTLGPATWSEKFYDLPEAQRRDLSRLATHLIMRALEKQSVGQSRTTPAAVAK